MFRGRRNRLIWLFSVALLLLSGCLGTGQYTVTGIVTEGDTGVPLWGAQVRVGSRRSITNAQGYYELTKVPGGRQELEVTLEGYEPYELEVHLEEGSVVNADLVTKLPPLNLAGLSFADWSDSVVPEQVNVSVVWPMIDLALLFGEEKLGWGIRKVEALLNGEPYPYNLAQYGAVDGPLPLRPGENTVQLRFVNYQGFARTTEPITLNFAVDRLDLHLVLTYDDLVCPDLHLFKRDRNEPNAFSWSNDHHVFWANQWPTDFGETAAQNPVMDWYGWYLWPLDSICVQELTPGDYHIWIHSWWLKAASRAELEIRLDGGTSSARTVVYELDLPLSSDFLPIYVATVRVEEDGTKSVIQVPAEPWVDPVPSALLARER